MMSLHDEALVRANNWNIDFHRGYYKKFRNLVNGVLDREKNAYLIFYVNNNKLTPKKMWPRIKNVLSSETLTTISSQLSNPDDINNFFFDLPGSDRVLTGHIGVTCRVNNSFKLEKCSDAQVIQIIKSIVF